MAEEDLDLDLEGGEKGGKKKLIIIIAAALVLLIGAGAGGYFLFMGDSGDEGATEADAQDSAAEEVVVQKKPNYLPLKKITVNLEQKGPARFLQLEMQLMSYDLSLFERVTEHMPAIRNDLLVLLGSKPYEQLSSVEGKETLRGEITDKINGVLNTQAGVEGGIEAVYFTRFIMQ